MKVLIKFLSEKAVLPEYKTHGSSGFDVRAVAVVKSDGQKIDLSEGDVCVVEPSDRIFVPTGLSFSMSNKYELQIRSRSGLAWKNGLFVLNSPGTLDSDYRGELCIIMLNTSDKNFEIKLGDRVAQAVFCPVIKADFSIVDQLDDTDRGAGGFGSTGVA